MEKPWAIPTVNPGRPPTRLGGDGINPWIRIYQWQAEHLVEWLRSRQVSHEWRSDGRRELPGHGWVPLIRVSFPGAKLGELQRLLTQWEGEVR